MFRKDLNCDIDLVFRCIGSAPSRHRGQYEGKQEDLKI